MDRPIEDENDGPPMPTQEELEAMFDADDADVEAGHTVPLEVLLDEAGAAAQEIRRRKAAGEPRVDKQA